MANPQHRIISYWITGIGLAVGISFGHSSGWTGSSELHTAMEAVATFLAVIVGAMALVRYYTKKQSIFLLVGAGFLGTGFLDGYHTLVTSTYFEPMMPSDLPALIPWSWVASRFFLAVFMVLSWVVWKREERLGAAGRLSERVIYIGTIIFSLSSFCFLLLPRCRMRITLEFSFNAPKSLSQLFSFCWHWLVI